ncbi:MAG: autotransporter outer membrane beta-barrel domain-containing protein, partial [Glaciimonas sp.]|nr:autotransporter outer membrane beta-barrel domain-containing protein [Glaciimonas sp.]
SFEFCKSFNINAGGAVNGLIGTRNNASLYVNGGGSINNAGDRALTVTASQLYIGTDISGQNAIVNGDIALLQSSTAELGNAVINGTIFIDDNSSMHTGSGTTINADGVSTSLNGVVIENSSITVDGSTINSAGASHGGMQISSNSTRPGSPVTAATLSNANISSKNGWGIFAVARFDGRTDVDISGGRINTEGSAAAVIAVASKTTVNIANGAHISSSGIGTEAIQMISGASVNVGSQAIIHGNGNGVSIISQVGSGYVDNVNTLTINNASVVGDIGSAIQVTDSIANINVQNGSILNGGNGNLLLVKGRTSIANATIDNSVLFGNVVAETGSRADITLQNHASLTGQLINVANLAVNNNSTWKMTGNGNVAAVSLDGGTINFNSGDVFRTLTLGVLSGKGTFLMGTDLAQHTGDLLQITGIASGDHTLHIKNTGIEPIRGDDALKIVETGGGDAQFGALGGKVDAGVYKYKLKQHGSDWFLEQSVSDIGKPIVTPSTDIVLGLFNTSPSVWYGEMSSLRSRMGELHLGKIDGGIWARTYGRGYSVDSGVGLGYKQDQSGLSVGADVPVAIRNGKLLLGALGGY